MNTVLVSRLAAGAKLMQAPASRPPTESCSATVPDASVGAATRPGLWVRNALSSSGAANTHAATRAANSAVRSRENEGLCRRRLRAGAWAGFAIGRAIVAARALFDPTVHRCGDPFASNRVEVDHG